jgi:hypothetical protein
MTEPEWLAYKEPYTMLEFLGDEASDRRLTLVACACCRRIWHLLPDDKARQVIEIVEQFADRLATASRVRVAGRALAEMPRPEEKFGHSAALACVDLTGVTGLKPSRVVGFVMAHAAVAAAHAATMAAREAEGEQQCSLLRDIFGNPFRRLPPRPAAIASLAERIYAGEWSLMPLLGEWLQEHGYWSEGEHCLDPKNQHVKGCWVVDWVSGRE